MRKIKLAYLISTLDTGGAERQLLNTVNGMDYNKYEVKIFILKDRLSLINQLNSNVSTEVLHVHSYANILKLRTVLKKIKIYKPHILHSQMYASNLLARSYKFYDKNCRVVNHIHGLGTWIKSHHIFLDKLLIKYVDKIIVVSKSSYNLRLRREKYPTNKLTILYNSLDTDKYLEVFNHQKEADDGIIIGSASRLVGLKQVNTIIDLVAVLLRKGLNVKYYIAGDGPEYDTLKSQVKAIDLESKIKFWGNIDEMSDFYKSIDIFIMNSRTEDMPLSIVEAFASGLFVIAPNIGGVKELLDNNDSLLFEPGADLHHLADKIITFINSNNIKSHSLKNRKFAVKCFDNNVHQNKLDSIYKEILFNV